MCKTGIIFTGWLSSREYFVVTPAGFTGHLDWILNSSLRSYISALHCIWREGLYALRSALFLKTALFGIQPGCFALLQSTASCIPQHPFRLNWFLDVFCLFILNSKWTVFNTYNKCYNVILFRLYSKVLCYNTVSGTNQYKCYVMLLMSYEQSNGSFLFLSIIFFVLVL